jgi:hypothetical protein
MPLTVLDPITALIVIDLEIVDRTRENSIRNVFPRLGETGSTQEIISLLKKRSLAA